MARAIDTVDEDRAGEVSISYRRKIIGAKGRFLVFGLLYSCIIFDFRV